MSPGVVVKCRVCKGPAVIDVRRHNAAFCRTTSSTTATSRCAGPIHSHRHARAGRAGARRGVGRQGLARAVGHPRAARLRGRRPLPRARHRRLLRRVRRATRARSPPSSGARCVEVDLAARVRLRHPGRRRRRPAASPCWLVRALEAPPLQLGRARARLRRRRHRAQPRRRSRRAARQRAALGRPATSAASTRCCPQRPGSSRKVKPLVRLGRAGDRGLLRAAAASTTRSRSARWPPATGTSGTRRCSTRSRTARPASKAAFLFGFLERGHERFARRRRRRARRAGRVPRVRLADARRRLRVLPAASQRRRRSSRRTSEQSTAEEVR